MKGKCLIVDEMHPSIIPLLFSIGWEPDYRPDITKKEVMDVIENYTGIIVRSKLKIDKEFLNKALYLQFVARAGAGIDNIEVDEVLKRKIELINAPEGNRDAVAEHTLGMILSLFNRFRLADQQVRNNIWDREGNRGYELKGKCVALIGYGYMGKAVAKRLKSFQCKVIAYDKYLENYSDEYVEEQDMKAVFEQADILSLHIPLTKETRGFVNYNYFKQFKKNIWLINTARGEIIPLKDLVMALEDGKIIGASLDVLENEKLASFTDEQKASFNYLTRSEKVLLTPHVAGWTFESYEKINEVLVEKIKAMHSALN